MARQSRTQTDIRWQVPNLKSITASGQESLWAPLWQCPESQAINTWIPVNMQQVLDGSLEAPEPTICRRTDGVGLLYEGETHAFNGESESGKSLIAQAITTGLISHGQRVLYIDFESDVRSVARRLKDMGATNRDITSYFAYVAPQTPHNNRDGNGQPVASNSIIAEAVFTQLLTINWKLVVIDGVEAALSLYRLDSNKQADIWTWQRSLPIKIAKTTGAAVVLIDHVVKNRDTRGRYAVGSGAKLNAITGATYLIEPISRIGKGLNGDLKILLAKDRAGGLRQHCAPERQGLDRAATVNIDSTRPDKPMIITFSSPITQTDKYRLTKLMETASKYIEAQNRQGRKPQQGAIRAHLNCKTENAQKALETLEEEGYITIEKHGSSYLHSSCKPYRQKDDPKSDVYQAQPKLNIEEDTPKDDD